MNRRHLSTPGETRSAASNSWHSSAHPLEPGAHGGGCVGCSGRSATVPWYRGVGVAKVSKPPL